MRIGQSLESLAALSRKRPGSWDAQRSCPVLRDYNQASPFLALLRDWRRARQRAGTPLKQWTLSAADYTRICEGKLELRGVPKPAEPPDGESGVQPLHRENVMALGTEGPGLGQRDCQSTPGRKWQ
jgi:hypothetical protein